jgi:hypothetical protein
MNVTPFRGAQLGSFDEPQTNQPKRYEPKPRKGEERRRLTIMNQRL